MYYVHTLRDIFLIDVVRLHIMPFVCILAELLKQIMGAATSLTSLYILCLYSISIYFCRCLFAYCNKVFTKEICELYMYARKYILTQKNLKGYVSALIYRTNPKFI